MGRGIDDNKTLKKKNMITSSGSELDVLTIIIKRTFTVCLNNNNNNNNNNHNNNNNNGSFTKYHSIRVRNSKVPVA